MHRKIFAFQWPGKQIHKQPAQIFADLWNLMAAVTTLSPSLKIGVTRNACHYSELNFMNSGDIRPPTERLDKSGNVKA